ncbi:hypothetical protein AMTRI_Chr13g85840 [Amborella trichopoda]
MLAIFSNDIVSGPQELIDAGSRTPSPKTNASDLLETFISRYPTAVSARVGTEAYMSYTHENQPLLQPRSFAMKEEMMCLFKGSLENYGRLRQEYGLGKNSNEVLLVMEAYKALRDRAPYPATHMVAHLLGQFAFVIFDNSTSTVFVASDQEGRVPLFWGITKDGYLAFADDVELLKASCGKSLASFPPGCYLWRASELKSYEHPKNKVTAVPATEEEICGATFKVSSNPSR